MSHMVPIRGPLGLKVEKKPKAKRPDGKDPAYLADVRRLPCIICVSWGYQQATPSQSHHPICERYSQVRVPDREAIPLCDGHHQGEQDTTKIAIHRDRALWVETYGSDREYIAATQDAVERLREERG